MLMNFNRIFLNKLIALIMLVCIMVSGFPSSSAVASGGCNERMIFTNRQLSRDDYADRLRAMWLGETIANWTGLTTEAVIQDAPFYTDEDWERDQGIDWKQYPIIDFVFQDPWLADDDTDIEYLYLHLLNV